MGKHTKAIEHGHWNNLPINSIVIFQSYVNVYQRVMCLYWWPFYKDPWFQIDDQLQLILTCYDDIWHFSTIHGLQISKLGDVFSHVDNEVEEQGHHTAEIEPTPIYRPALQGPFVYHFTACDFRFALLRSKKRNWIKAHWQPWSLTIARDSDPSIDICSTLQ